jgi:hypothetical protein
VQNPDGTYTVIEYPAKKEVMINLNPVAITGAKGIATILRDDDGTRIKLNLTDIPAEVTSLNLYAVDDSGTVTPVGQIAITNGVGTLSAAVPMAKFMLVVSPDAQLASYNPDTAVLFRSAVPEGFTVIPLTSPSGEKVAAVAAPVVQAAAPYTVAMLNILRQEETTPRSRLTFRCVDWRARTFSSRHEKMDQRKSSQAPRFEGSAAGQSFILWAVS